jgi:hypothetical protein
MFWFHKLSAGNGKNPFKLAPCPTLITLHALGVAPPPPPPPPPLVLAVTVTLIVDDALSPGFGLLTLTAYVPAVASFPVADNCVAEVYVVVSAAPAHITVAPCTKLLPFTVSVNDPAVNVDGDTLAIDGVGFSSVTALDPVALVSTCEAAVTVIVLGFGNAAGAV